MPIKKIPGFTLAEMLVTLALTSMMITFCYLSFNYTQHLLSQFNRQSYFITQLSELKKRGDRLMHAHSLMLQEDEKKIIFKSDSSEHSLEFTEELILMRHAAQTDTFHLAPKKISISYEAFSNPAWQHKLVNTLELDVYFQKQNFHLVFRKRYDALTRLQLEKEE